MGGVTLSPHAAGIVKLLGSLKQSKGDMSYRMEGIFQAVSAVCATFTTMDKNYIAEAILLACREFNEFDKTGGAPTNRFAIKTLKNLSE
jgi:hypothetical protein